MACFLCRGWLFPSEPKFSIYFYLRLQPPLHTRKALIPNSINILYAADETLLLYIGKKALKSIFLLCACLKTVLLKVDMATNHLQFVSSWSWTIWYLNHQLGLHCTASKQAERRQFSSMRCWGVPLHTTKRSLVNKFAFYKIRINYRALRPGSQVLILFYQFTLSRQTKLSTVQSLLYPYYHGCN